MRDNRRSLSVQQMQRPSLNFLLSSAQPSILYQAYRDILEDDKQAIREQRQILQKGWGEQLMACRDDNGLWENSLYSPKWTSTTYSMLLLRRMEPVIEKRLNVSAILLAEKGIYSDGGINFSNSMKNSETCISGMILYILSYFAPDNKINETLKGYLLDEQMDDGGWNCRKYKGATHGSFHTTVNVIEGLASYGKYISKDRAIERAIGNAMEFLLIHRLFKSHRTGDIVDRKMTMFSFPPRWRYDIMRILDFAAAGNFIYDSRMDDAVAILKKKKIDDGFFKMQNRHAGRTYFEMDKPGQIGLWNTLRGMRIMKWLHNNGLEI